MTPPLPFFLGRGAELFLLLFAVVVLVVVVVVAGFLLLSVVVLVVVVSCFAIYPPFIYNINFYEASHASTYWMNAWLVTRYVTPGVMPVAGMFGPPDGIS